MKYLFSIQFVFLLLSATSCSNADAAKTVLTPTEFSSEIASAKNLQLVDVRTPDEFATGHIKNAKNIDWNNSNFAKEIANLDKSEIVYVYCHSGRRSGMAAASMRESGFKDVRELEDGIVAWTAAQLPLETMSSSSNGMSLNDFSKLLVSDKIVLVDFYAEWCGPCKKMTPFLEEIQKEMAESVTVIRIDIDKHPDLANELNIQSIPVLHVYKNEKLTWNHTGYIQKEAVVENLK